MAAKQHSTPRVPRDRATNQKSSKQTKKPAKPAVKPIVGKSKFAPDAVVKWLGKENPFQKDCGAWKRTEIVRKASGETVVVVQAKAGLRGSTLATLARMELIKVSGG
jgi:hypothetical protein